MHALYPSYNRILKNPVVRILPLRWIVKLTRGDLHQGHRLSTLIHRREKNELQLLVRQFAMNPFT